MPTPGFPTVLHVYYRIRIHINLQTNKKTEPQVLIHTERLPQIDTGTVLRVPKRADETMAMPAGSFLDPGKKSPTRQHVGEPRAARRCCCPLIDVLPCGRIVNRAGRERKAEKRVVEGIIAPLGIFKVSLASADLLRFLM